VHADLTLLHASPFARLVDFRCNHREGCPSEVEYQANFAVSFTRRGAFEFRLGKRASTIHSGVLLLENPDTERAVRHYGALKDDCTAIELSDDFFFQLFAEDLSGKAPPSTAITKGFPKSVLPVTPRLEALHSLIFNAGKTTIPGVTLRIDALVIELLWEIALAFDASAKTWAPCSLDRKMREFYLENIDRARKLMQARFREELSLCDIARDAGISLFHFSRIFKQFTTFSPHKYLIHLRLEHARLLLRNTFLSVTEICFESGFNSLEHFSSAFTRQYGLSPRRYRGEIRRDAEKTLKQLTPGS
jgi:AraC family transcriptional regulator